MAGVTTDPLLTAVLNLSRFHRAHEQFYAEYPREQAVMLQRHARTLKALADRWTRYETVPDQTDVPYSGSEDLNDDVALQLDGVLFMEGGGEPVEVRHLKDVLRSSGEGNVAIGAWLATAMEQSWSAAVALFEYPSLADLFGERQRIIANDWQAADMSRLAGRLLLRSVEMLDRLTLTPEALRRDLSTDRFVPELVYSAAELVDRAADLLSDSAGLVHENERRWRTFRARVAMLASAAGPETTTRPEDVPCRGDGC
jgi:hypothetical protein